MATTGTFANYFREYLADGAAFSFTADTIAVGLLTSSWTPSNWNGSAGNKFWSDISANEVSTTNTGYTALGGSGKTVTSKSVEHNTNKLRCKGTIAAWTAGSANLTARYMALAKWTGSAASSPILGWLLLDSTPADVTATSGGTFTLTQATDGWFYL